MNVLITVYHSFGASLEVTDLVPAMARIRTVCDGQCKVRLHPPRLRGTALPRPGPDHLNVSGLIRKNDDWGLNDAGVAKTRESVR